MSNELEDVVVFDVGKKTVINFTRFVPPNLDEEILEGMEELDFDELLSGDQARYGIDYFGSEEVRLLEKDSKIAGGHRRPGIKHLKTFLRLSLLPEPKSLPEDCSTN